MMRKGHFVVVFIGVILTALFLRLYALGHVPYSLYWDEAAMLVDVKSVLSTGHDMHNRPWFQVIYPSYGDFKLPMYIWLAIASSKIFGLSEWALRLPSALAGIGTILVAGTLAKYFAKDLPTKLVQLMTMGVVAFSPWSIMFSRTGFEGHVGQFLLAMSMWCVCASKQKRWLLYAAPIFGALATYSYFSVRFVWAVVFVLTVAMLYRSEIFLKTKSVIQKSAQLFLLPLIIFGVLLLPMLRSPLYNDANRFRLGTDSILKTEDQTNQANLYRELAGNTKFDRVLFQHSWLTFQALLKNYSDNLNLNFLFITGDPNIRHGTGEHGLFLWLLLPFLFVGLYYFFTHDKFSFLVLVLWWLIALLPASVPLNTPHALRSLNALVPLAIILGSGIAFVCMKLYVNKIGKQALMLYGALFFLAIVEFSFHYFVLYPKDSAKDWQGGYKQLAQQIFATKKDNQKVFVLPFDDRFYLWLMAYGPYSGQDFQKWHSRDYKFEDSIPDVVSQIPDKTQILQGALVAAEPKRFQELLPNFGAKPDHVQEIRGEDGSVRFVLAQFSQK